MRATAVICLGVLLAFGCGGSGGGDGSIDSGAQPGDPVVSSVTASKTSITEGEAVTFTAIVTDSDGTGDIAGGTLATVDPATTLGAFVQKSGGTYTLDVTWTQIAAARAIEFTSDEQRTFRVEFVDNAGRKGSRETSLTLTCGGRSACDSRCVDRMNDASHCGTCGHVCRVEGTSGGCEEGRCRPAYTECLVLPTFATCDAACAAQGETCAICGGVPSLYYSTLSDCEEHSSSVASGETCAEQIRSGVGEAIRCCCASAP